MKKSNCLAAYFQAQKGHFRTKIARYLNSYKKKNEDTTFLVYLRTKKSLGVKTPRPDRVSVFDLSQNNRQTLRNKLNAFLEQLAGFAVRTDFVGTNSFERND